MIRTPLTAHDSGAQLFGAKMSGVGSILPADFRNVVLRLRQTAMRLDEVHLANQQLQAERDALSAELAACRDMLAQSLGEADTAEARAEAKLVEAREAVARSESERRQLEVSLHAQLVEARHRQVRRLPHRSPMPRSAQGLHFGA